MGMVYRNLKDMPFPPFAYPDRHDGRVYIIVTDEDGKSRRRIIGHMTDSTPGQERMIPNDYFKSIYPDLFSETYPYEKIPAHEMSIGLYALTLGITDKTGLYALLQSIYGMTDVNSILDYAMFLIADRSCTTQLFEKRMDREVLFSDKLHSDSYYSKFFAKTITEDQHHQFRIKWVKQLVDSGLKRVWLAIDGSNNDCEARQSFLSEYGFPKSHNKNKTIVGYMYAVDAETGLPVTYYVYEGSVPDCKAFQWMATFLGGFNIEIEGIILDRGFAVEEVFRKIEEEKWKYVIMIPTDTYGHKLMYENHGNDIRWNAEYVLEEDAIFGIADQQRLFGDHERVSNICLYYDGGSGSLQSIRLIKKIQAAKRKAEAAISNGKRAGIERTLRKYLRIDGEGPDRVVVPVYEEWNLSMAGKGFFSLATSDGIGPDEANRLYKKRDTSETQFSIMKSQEGGDVTRVHKTEGIYSKFALLFLSSIIRFKIEEACKKLEIDTNPMIQSMRQITLLYTADNRYQAVRRLNTEQKSLFTEFRIDYDLLEKLAQEYNNRNRTDSKNPERSMPSAERPVTRINSRRVGRPPKNAGFENTKDEENSESSQAAPVKSKGGRPKGCKDSKPRKSRSDKGKTRGPNKRTLTKGTDENKN